MFPVAPTLHRQMTCSVPFFRPHRLVLFLRDRGLRLVIWCQQKGACVRLDARDRSTMKEHTPAVLSQEKISHLMYCCRWQMIKVAVSRCNRTQDLSRIPVLELNLKISNLTQSTSAIVVYHVSDDNHKNTLRNLKRHIITTTAWKTTNRCRTTTKESKNKQSDAKWPWKDTKLVKEMQNKDAKQPLPDETWPRKMQYGLREMPIDQKEM